jgi:hypothetical protein
MDCCALGHSHGHELTRRQWMWSTVLSSVGTTLAGGVGPRGSTAAAKTAETASAALDVLRERAELHLRRRPTTPSQTACGRDRWRSPALQACLTLPPSAEIQPGSSACCARRSRGNSTSTILSVSIGWTKWSPTMACVARFQQPISTLDRG